MKRPLVIALEITAALLALLLAFLLLPGCSNGSRPPVTQAAAGPVPTLSQSGAAAAPGTASHDTTTETVPLAAGSTVTTAPPAPDGTPGPLVVTLSAPAVLTRETTHAQVEGAKAFSPPTVAEQTDASTRRLFMIGAVIGCAAALFGFAKGFPLVGWGGGVVAVSCALGAFWLRLENAAFAGSGVALGAGLAVAGILCWHFIVKPREAQLMALLEKPKSPAA